MYGNLKGYSITQPVDSGVLNGFFDTLKEIANKATDIYNQNAAQLDPLRDQAASNLVKSYLPASAGTAQTPATTGSNTPPPAAKGMSTGAKVGIGLLGVGIVGGTIWAITSSGKKKNAK